MAYAHLMAHAYLLWWETPPARFVFSALPVMAGLASERDGSDLLPKRSVPKPPALQQKWQSQKHSV
jgi:hypothetical protein